MIVLRRDAQVVRCRITAPQSHALTRLWKDQERLRWSCTCGAAKAGQPCEHLVATILTIRGPEGEQEA